VTRAALLDGVCRIVFGAPPRGGRLGAAALAAVLWLAANASAAETARVVLRENATTSAGVYDNAGRLVRTLWSGRRQSAGAIEIEWDGRDDTGVAAPPAGAPHVVRVLAHNVHYVWEGVIGNTSLYTAGVEPHRALYPIASMAIAPDGSAFYAVGYNELQSALYRFDSSSPQHRTAVAPDDHTRVFLHAATDGRVVYFANAGQLETFVVAFRVADGGVHAFGAGTAASDKWPSVIDRERTDAPVARGSKRFSAPTGLAVERRGNALFVAHHDADEIRVFDKRSGAPLATLPVPGAGKMDVAPDDSLWAIARGAGVPEVRNLRRQGAGWTLARTITAGLIDPVALGVSPVDGTVVVADAGSDQLKAFDSAGDPLWTYGVEGGYRSGDPRVADDKLWLAGDPTYVAFAADGSFWFGDPGNVRNLHLSAAREVVERIMFLPKTYIATVDPAAPSRVFRHFLEFEVDYSAPIRESWRLVRNWAAGVGEKYRGVGWDGLKSVYTLPNGRAYGVLLDFARNVNVIVELTPQGLRETGVRLDTNVRLYADGSLRTHKLDFGGLRIHIRRLAGFDPRGNPQWQPWTLLASVPKIEPTDPYWHDVPDVEPVNAMRYVQTASGLVVSFNPSRSEGFHLGGIRPGTEGWAWRASPSGSWELDERGQIVHPDGRYEIGRNVQYPGNVVMTSGAQIVFGYHGEAWNGGQANQWLHFDENGLFVGQFGRANYAYENLVVGRPETAGNAFSAQLVEVNGHLYLWHNDESCHGGVHRWRIDGLDTMKTLEARLE
jgi:DNA-binding beta-propeller fold protein YncE